MADANNGSHTQRRRRSVLIGALSLLAVQLARNSGATQTRGVTTVDVWVDLDLPALVSKAGAEPAEREALRARIIAQQRDVLAALKTLGAVERGRVQQLRNAIAVTLAREQIDAARRIPGVRAVRVVRHAERTPPPPRD
jgi:hypothetical protein